MNSILVGMLLGRFWTKWIHSVRHY